MTHTVSIILPTRNAGEEFRDLLERVRTQKGFHDVEIVVVDSQSSDATPEIALQYGAKVVEICASSFNHGLTRNLGIQEAHGDICVLLVQDALPVHDCWLRSLVNPFEQDPSICGVTTAQIPRPQCDIVGRWEIQHHNSYLGQEFATRSIPDWDSFRRLSLQERFFACNFDNVCSAIRRSAWEEYPFRPLAFAEDLDWGVRILRAGKKIVYEPAAVVLHSHVRPAIYHLRRQYISAKLVPEILDAPVPGIFSSEDGEVFAAADYLIQEVFSLLLLIDQFQGSIQPRLWCEWIKSAERSNIIETSANGNHLGSKYVRIFGDWLCRSPKQKSSLTVKNVLPVAIRVNPMRVHFFFLLSAVPQDVPALDAAALRHLLVHCLARVLGHFLGSYYLWAARRNRLSSDLQSIDRALSIGV
jgi:rhamnosyltransferase